MFDGLYMFRPPLKMVILGMVYYLVGGLEHECYFPIYWELIPFDFHMFQRDGSTTNQLY